MSNNAKRLDTSSTLWVKHGHAPDSSSKTVADKSSVQARVAENNEQCFRLMEINPLTQPEWISLLGYDGCSTAADNIIHGHHEFSPDTSTATDFSYTR